MTVNLELLRQAIKDGFEPIQLFDYLGVTMDEFLDAFPDRWETNEDLMDALDFWDDECYTDEEWDKDDNSQELGEYDGNYYGDAG